MTFSDNHFDEMEQAGQISLFDVKKIEKDTVVRVKRWQDMDEGEDRDYFEYHSGKLCGRKGIVKQVNKRILSNFYLVEIDGENHYFYENELVVIE